MKNIFNKDLDTRREMMLNGDIVSTMMFLTIPTFMMAIVSTLIPFSDSLFLNVKLGNNIAAAVSYVQPAINMIISLSQGFGVVAMSMIGQLNGKNDENGVKKISLQILLFSFFIGVLLIPIVLLSANLFAPDNVVLRQNAITYFSLYAFIVPLQFMAAIFNSIKSATGEPEATFYRMVVLLLLKLFFNTIFLLIFDMGIYGSIYASLSAYFITGVWMYYDLFIKKYKFKLSLKDYKFDIIIIKELITLSIPSMLTYMGINLGFFLINREVVVYGSSVLSGLAIATQITNICFTLPTCVSTTVTTMISTNIGVGNVKKSKQIFNKGLIIGNIVAFILVILVLPSSKYLVNIFTNNVEIGNIAIESLQIYIYSVFPYSVFMMCQAVYNALGRTIYPLIMSFLRIWFLRYFFILLTSSFVGYYSVFYGNLVSNFISGAIFYIMVKKSSWRSNISYE